MPERFPLNLPPADLHFRKYGGEIQVYDRIRRKYVAATPEEIVRQHFVEWLINGLKYPETHIANEVGLKYNDMTRRADTIIADCEGSPLMVVEYKAPTVRITQDVFDQIARYNSVFHARYVVVSNGINHYCCKMRPDSMDYDFIRNIPDYQSISFPFSEN